MTALDTVACATHLKIKIQLLGVMAFVMIDSNATENFMFDKFAKNYQIPGLLKKRLYQLTIVNGIPLNQDERMVRNKHHL